jgi:hypothetical protein
MLGARITLITDFFQSACSKFHFLTILLM